MKGAKKISFLYDGMGKRVRKFAEAIGTATGFSCGWLEPTFFLTDNVHKANVQQFECLPLYRQYDVQG